MQAEDWPTCTADDVLPGAHGVRAAGYNKEGIRKGLAARWVAGALGAGENVTQAYFRPWKATGQTVAKG